MGIEGIGALGSVSTQMAMAQIDTVSVKPPPQPVTPTTTTEPPADAQRGTIVDIQA